MASDPIDVAEFNRNAGFCAIKSIFRSKTCKIKKACGIIIRIIKDILSCSNVQITGEQYGIEEVEAIIST